jgi:MoaA/NifB/PqqE/SkfB family radical SAM enzyme
LQRLVARALALPWCRRVEVGLFPGGVVVRYRDPAGLGHALELRRVREGAPCFLRGRTLAGAYRLEQDGLDPAPHLERYRRALAGLLAQEADVLRWVRDRLPGEAEGGAFTDPWLRERDLLRALPADDDRPQAQLAAMQALLEARLPPGFAGEVMLYLDNPCQQRCTFCVRGQSPGRFAERLARTPGAEDYASGTDLFHRGGFDALLAALARREPAPVLCVSGDDWALNPALELLLAALERAPRVPVRLYGPSTALAEPALARRVARLPALEGVTLSLFAADPAVHDRVTGTPGSGERALAAVGALLAQGVRPRVNVVLVREAVAALPATLALLGRLELSAHLLAFWPARHPAGWDAEHLFAPLQDVRRALEAEPDPANPVTRVLVGLPPCAIPPRLRVRARPPWQDGEQEPAVYPAPCSGCGLRPRCGGVPASYAAWYGDRGVLPESSGQD